MNHQPSKHLIFTSTTIAMLLSACSSLPESMQAIITPPVPIHIPDYVTAPSPTTIYHCAGGKKLHVRYREDGSQAWVILPDRELMLNRIPSQVSSRYSNGVAILDAKDSDATLATGTAVAYTECKVPKM